MREFFLGHPSQECKRPVGKKRNIFCAHKTDIARYSSFSLVYVVHIKKEVTVIYGHKTLTMHVTVHFL